MAFLDLILILLNFYLFKILLLFPNFILCISFSSIKLLIGKVALTAELLLNLPKFDSY